MRRRALLCVVGSAALAGCGGRLGDDAPTNDETDRPETPEATTTTEPEPRLELVSHELARSNEGSASELATVVGTARNTADEPIREATVTAAFEDTDGETLDRASASVSDVSPGQSWSFEVVYPGTGEDARAVADYGLAVETGE